MFDDCTMAPLSNPHSTQPHEWTHLRDMVNKALPQTCCAPPFHSSPIRSDYRCPHPSNLATLCSHSRSPDCHSRDLKSLSHLRLASGDRDGLVVVWDVLSQSPVAALDDSTAVLSHGSRRSSGGGVAGTFVAGGAVQGLAWVRYRPRLLAVLTAPATLLLWDSRGEIPA